MSGFTREGHRKGGTQAVRHGMLTPVMPTTRRALLVLASLAACTDATAPASGEDDSSGSPAADTGTTAVATDAGSSGTGVPDDAPRFYEDVLPLVAQHCQGCHVAEGIGPFDLTDYATAAALAPSFAASTAARQMPPFVASNTGECNTFANARWLADDEIDLLQRWADAGAPEGDATLARPQPPAPEQLAGDDIVTLKSPAGYAPVADDAGPADDYQCFLVDPQVGDTARYLIGYEVVPGNAQVTHHMIGFLVDPSATTPLGGTNGSLMQSLDDGTPDQPGWDCFGAAGNGVLVEGTPVTWAPGGGAFNFPAGTGIRIDPGYVLVLQMHYNLAAGSGSDQSELRLSMVDEVEREAVNALDDRFLATLFNGGGVTLPPGESSTVWQWRAPLREWDSRISAWPQVELLGMLPHMHALGRRMQVTIKRSGDDAESCGLYVDRWDFNWQQAFMYDTPILLSPSDQLEITCEWDTSSRQSPVAPGLGTSNEMCLLGVYAAAAK